VAVLPSSSRFWGSHKHRIMSLIPSWAAEGKSMLLLQSSEHPPLRSPINEKIWSELTPKRALHLAWVFSIYNP
jgi:hypothetical protein